MIRPTLKQHTAMATVCTTDPSGSVMARADEASAEAAAWRSFDAPEIDVSGGVGTEGGGVGVCTPLMAFCSAFFPLLGLETNFDRT